MLNNMTNKPITSIKNIFIIAFVVVISFISIKLLGNNVSTSYMVFGNIFSIIIDLLVVLTFFYATMRSANSGRRV